MWIKEQFWDMMPVKGRWIIYSIMIFILTMVLFGSKIYSFFGW